MEETDMCIQPTSFAPARQQQVATSCPAKLLDPQQRRTLAVQALAGAEPITQLAAEYDVSRKFVYQQAAKAEQTLQEAFAPAAPANDKVLFTIPVTKRWLRRFIIALLLISHCSYRGVVELLRDVFRYSLSVERVHALAHEAMDRARELPSPSLSRVRQGAHDERRFPQGGNY
jgi:hypothetical protein